MGSPVTVFNTSPSNMSLVINNGGQIQLPPTGAGQNWEPVATQAGQTTQMPGQGTLGFGQNLLQVQGDGGPIGQLTLNLPYSQMQSVQIYLSAAQTGGGLYLLMTDGMVASYGTF